MRVRERVAKWRLRAVTWWKGYRERRRTQRRLRPEFSIYFWLVLAWGGITTAFAWDSIRGWLGSIGLLCLMNAALSFYSLIHRKNT